MTDKAGKTPILEILRNTPIDARATHDVRDGLDTLVSSQLIPYGKNAHEAADEIERLTPDRAYAQEIIAQLGSIGCGSLLDEKMRDRAVDFIRSLIDRAG